MKTKKSIKTVISITLVTLILLTGLNAYAESPEVFTLTSEEEAYLGALSSRELVIAGTSEIMSFTGSNGEPTGILLPLLEVLRGKWGLNVKTVSAGWSNCFKMLESGEADLMGLAVLTQDRTGKYYSTEEIFSPNMAVYTRMEDPLINIVNMSGKTMGMLGNSTVMQIAHEYINADTLIHEYG